jgi:hypothetical protein
MIIILILYIIIFASMVFNFWNEFNDEKDDHIIGYSKTGY